MPVHRGHSHLIHGEGAEVAQHGGILRARHHHLYGVGRDGGGSAGREAAGF